MKNIKNFIFNKTKSKRRAFFLLCDIFLISAAMYISFWSRFNGDIPSNYEKTLPYYIGLALIIKLFYLIVFNVYDISWRYVGLDELIKVVKAMILGSLTLGMIMFFFRTIEPFSGPGFPRSIFIIDFIFCLFFIGSLRASKRLLTEGLKSTLKYTKDKKRLLIMGAGDAGGDIVKCCGLSVPNGISLILLKSSFLLKKRGSQRPYKRRSLSYP
jgi:FlaA1/EpsC-like NDP-sugar epimerase